MVRRYLRNLPPDSIHSLKDMIMYFHKGPGLLMIKAKSKNTKM
jgi:hypothetical protein